MGNIFKTAALVAFLAFKAAAIGGAAMAAGTHSTGHGAKKMGHGEKMGHGADKDGGHAMAIGEPGDAAKVSRTIAIDMIDNAFEPESIAIKKGETIRFVVANKGEFLHEFNIGTAAMHSAHQSEMAKMMENGMLTATGVDTSKMAMKHNDPNSVLLAPGKQAEVIWRFSKSAKLEFACNVPGHYESGMMGPIQFKDSH